MKNPKVEISKINANAEISIPVDTCQELINLKYTPKQVLSIIIPVATCMFITIFVIFLTKSACGINYNREDLLDTNGYKRNFSNNNKISDSLWETLYSCLISVSFLIFYTCLMLLIIKLNWMKLIKFILYFTLAFLFLFVSVLFWVTMLTAIDLTVDCISFFLLIVNNAVLAFFCIMWKGPRRLVQAYHIHLSILIAWFLNNQTTMWFGWLILVILSIWDLFAVLPKYGPLNLIIKILDKRGQNIPNALIYSTYFEWSHLNASIQKFNKPFENFVKNLNQNNNNLVENNLIESQTFDININQLENDPKLGIGDFVFYSLLIAKASTQLNVITLISCFLGIIIGLLITMLVVAYLKRPMPALPLSIFIAIILFFTAEIIVAPFCDRLSLSQIFI